MRLSDGEPAIVKLASDVATAIQCCAFQAGARRESGDCRQDKMDCENTGGEAVDRAGILYGLAWFRDVEGMETEAFCIDLLARA